MAKDRTDGGELVRIKKGRKKENNVVRQFQGLLPCCIPLHFVFRVQRLLRCSRNSRGHIRGENNLV